MTCTMSDDEDDDLFADSDDEDETPVKKKSPVKKAPAKASKASADDDDDDDDLFDSDDDDDDEEEDQATRSKKKKAAPAKKPAKAALSKRERLEALAKKKRSGDEPQTSKTDGNKSSKKKQKDSDGSKKKEDGYDSGDSYDSATFTRTKDDDDFIDTTGEDADAVAELYADQHFDDERPMEEKKKKRKISDRDQGGEGGGPRGEREELNEDGVPVNPIMAAVHKMKRKKREKKSLEEVEDEIRTFLGKMELCVEEDEQAVSERRPAMAKLQFLGKVEEMFARRDMQRNLLDMDVLSVCKRWIQPLPNGKLGNVTVRHRLLTSISQLNNGTDNGITANDLRRSELGKVVMILFKHPDETPSMKRLAKQLIEQWSRPIFQKSGIMRDLERVGRQGTGLAAIKRRADVQQQMYDRQEMERKQVDSGKHANLQSLIATGRSGNAADSMSASANRVRVPFSKGFAYSVRPMNKTDTAPDTGASPIKGGTGDNRGKLAKRMVEKGRSVAKNQRSANISVEGRATKG